MEHTLTGTVAFVGDIHGDLYDVSYQIEKLPSDVKNIIFLGDIGFGFFGDGQLENKFLKYIPKHIKIWLLRGNHDNPIYWEVKYIVNPYPRLNFIKDCDVLNINGKRFLVVGGGISIDRDYRTGGKSYWSDEYVKLPDKNLLEDNIHGIISHSGIKPPVLEGSLHPLIENSSDEMKADLKREEDIFNTILTIAKPKEWFYGHFHTHCFFECSDCKFYNLDISEIYLYD